MKESVISLKKNGLPQPLCVSPAGSVGASASQRCPPDTRTFAMTGRRFSVHSTVFAATKRFVILNAQRERIRIPFKRETDCHGAKAPRNDERRENGLQRPLYMHSRAVERTARAFILKNKIYNYTQRRADKRRYSRGKQSPLKAARFLFYCKQRGRAGPVHKRKDYNVHGGFYRPPV